MSRARRDSGLEMNFDGLTDSVTNLVGALILVLVLVIGMTDDAVSGAKQLAPKGNLDKQNLGEHPIAPLQQQVLNLQAQIRTADQEMSSLQERVQRVNGDVDALLEKLQKVQAPKVDEKPQPELPTTDAREVSYRPPFEKIELDRKATEFVLEDGRASHYDLEPFQQWINLQSTTAKPGSSKVDYTIPQTDFKVIGSIDVKNGDIEKFDLTVVRLPNALGETVDEIERSGSKFQQKLSTLDPKKHTISFDVYPDSFETFRKLRALAWKAGFDVGWHPRDAGQVVRLSRGSGVDATQ